MNRDDVMALANQTAGQNWMDEAHIQRFAGLVAAAERERIIVENAPEIKKINEHIKALEEAVAAEREACAKVCEARVMGDNNREDEEAKRCAAAIREQG